MKKNSNPTFVIGTGRCGLTPLMDLISYHKSLSWPSQYNAYNPNFYSLSFLSRIHDISIVSSLLKFKRYIPKHSEAYTFWNSLFLGFRRPFRDLEAHDVMPNVEEKFHNAIGKLMKYQGKEQFIAEYSGWSRIAFFNEIFPHCRFIHIVRDGRAVANSLLNVSYWKGWEGIHKWRWGVPDNELLGILDKYNYSYIALAAIQWKILVNNIMHKSKILSQDRFLTVRYEDMVNDPLEIANKCIDFIGVGRDFESFQKHLRRVKIIDANNNYFRIPSWRESLSANQIHILNDILKKELDHFSYFS